LKILNLYAGIGGNRKHWGDEHDITAVEYDEGIAKIYADLFPGDTLVIGDAHQYLLDHHKEFDFIWSSPPCQTHSSFRYNIDVRLRGSEEKYPDMTLYEEIVFLKYHSEALWVIENVVPYYGAMLDPVKRNRHLYWSNFDLPEVPKTAEKLRSMNKISELEELHGYDLSNYRLPNKRQVLRNVVDPNVGRLFLEAATKEREGKYGEVRAG
jgi:DNA (cytosine-5)-methyltransferase 1